MADKPTRAPEYRSEQVDLVRSTCLYVATKLGDLVDEVVVVGGLVPSLLIDQGALPEGAAAHVGTMDLDVGLKLALLDEGRYRKLTERLRDAGFSQDQTEEGRPTRQRWRITGLGSVTMDFLIPPSRATDQAGKLRDIESDFAAIIAPGLKLAFLGRGEDKDAYDLYYLLRNFGAGVEDVAACLRPLLRDDEATKALQVLRGDFLDHDGAGPRRVAEFLQGGPDDEIQADVCGFVAALLDAVRAR